jgi:uncharacterized protein (DUF2267 family)
VATDYADFIATVGHEAEIPFEEAERAAVVTLETLSERITAGEAHDVAELLPEALRPVLDREEGEPEPFSADEFFHRVQEREHVPPLAAQRHVVAVFAALRRAVSPDELADLASQLPRPLELLLVETEPWLEGEDVLEPPRSADEFLDRVARRASLDREGARRATEAALEVLAIRISGGEVDDLIRRLPAELHRPLQRGRAEGGESARMLPLKQFQMAIADREGVTRAEARLHARAVFATLREAVGDDEIADIASQLPHEYISLIPRPYVP